MKRKTILLAVLCGLLVGVVIIGGGQARADDVAVVRDTVTAFRINSQGLFFGCPNGIFSCALGPNFQNYNASSSFGITKITFDWSNTGSNNCVGFGNYGAIITADATQDTVIATSTNTVYLGCAGFGGDGGGTHGSGELDFMGQQIPANFYLTFGAFDGGIQGGSNVGVSNIAIFASPVVPKEPVVIIPGIMGSRLVVTSTAEEAWPNVTKMIASGNDSYLDALRLGADGQPAQNEPSLYTSDIVREATGTFLGIPVDADFYGDLVQSFIHSGYQEGKDLFVAPYDWRLDVASQSAALGVAIDAARAASPNGKINIIAHSMGGLLLEKYLSGIADTTFVDRAILVGVPQLGAPKAFTILNYGDDLGLRWLGLFGLNPNEVKSITQNMPSIYELLPSRRYVQVAGSYVQDLRVGGGNQFMDYDRTNAFMTSDPVDSRNTALFGIADALHQGLDARSINATHVYNIVGCSMPTITGFTLYDGGVVDVNRGNGDGVVPVTSAMNLADGYTNYFILGDQSGVDHSGLVADANILSLMNSLITTTSSAVSLPAGVSLASVDCLDPGSSGNASATVVGNETSYEFSIHNAVTLDAYDAQNRHTGITASGDIEMAIPGSTYDVIGANAFITVPATSTYKVTIHNSSSSVSSSKKPVVKIRGFKKSATDKVLVYPSVPITDSSTEGQITFSGFNGDAPLMIDGNGTTSIIQPIILPANATSLVDIFSPPAVVTSTPTSTPVVISTSTPPTPSSTPTSTFKTISIPLDAFERGRGRDQLLHLQTKARVRLGVSLRTLRTAIGQKAKIISATVGLTVAANGRDWGKSGGVVELRPLGSHDKKNKPITLTITNNTSGTIAFDVSPQIKSFSTCFDAREAWALDKSQDRAPGSIGFYSSESKHGRPMLTVVYQ